MRLFEDGTFHEPFPFALPIKRVTKSGLYRGDDFSHVDEATCRATARRVGDQAPKLTCLDIERSVHFSADGEHSTAEIVNALSWFRDEVPWLLLSVYSYLPLRWWNEITSPGWGARATAYRQAWKIASGQHLQGIARHVNVVQPSLYCLGLWSQWQGFADAMLGLGNELYARPCVPYLWALHNNSKQYLGDAAVWQMLETCARHKCWGVVFYEGKSDRLPQSFFSTVTEFFGGGVGNSTDPV